MCYSFPPDLQRLVADRLASDEYQSEEDVLRDAMRALAQQDEDLLAVQQAISEWKQGDQGMSLELAFRLIEESKLQRDP